MACRFGGAPVGHPGMETLPQVCLARVARGLEAKDLATLGRVSRAMRRDVAGPDCWGPCLHRDFGLHVSRGVDPRAVYAALREQARCPAVELRFKALGTDGGVDRDDLERYWVDHMFNSRDYDSYCSERGENVHCFAVLADQRAEGDKDALQDVRRKFLLQRLRVAANVFVPGGSAELQRWASADVEAFALELLQHVGAEYSHSLENMEGQVHPGGGTEPWSSEIQADGAAGPGAGAGAGEGGGGEPELEALSAHAQGTVPVGMLLVADRPLACKRKGLQLVGKVLQGRPRALPSTETFETEEDAAGSSKIASGSAGSLTAPENHVSRALPPMLWCHENLTRGWGRSDEGLEVAVIRGIEVSRRGNFTCPVACGAVFVGMGAEDPPTTPNSSAWAGGVGLSECVRKARRAGRDGPFAPFDDLDTPEKVFAASSSGHLPPILRHRVHPAGIVIEFEPTYPPQMEYSYDPRMRQLEEHVERSAYAVLQPVVWFRFSNTNTDNSLAPNDGPRGGNILEATPLECQRVGNLACVKLISCENRMAEMGDLNEVPNIDINYVKFLGATTRLDRGMRAF